MAHQDLEGLDYLFSKENSPEPEDLEPKLSKEVHLCVQECCVQNNHVLLFIYKLFEVH